MADLVDVNDSMIDGLGLKPLETARLKRGIGGLKAASNYVGVV